MRVLKLMLALSLVLLPAGCKHINEIDEQLAAYEKRISALETAVAELRSQIDAVQKLLSGKFFVEDVAPLADDSGYRLVLSDSYNNITEYNILNGLDPVISVRQDTDGNWYWTVNGEWLMVDGAKMRANGEAGATPVVKVQDGKWYVSFDGVGWIYAGDAVPGGAGIFTGIVAATVAMSRLLYSLSADDVLPRCRWLGKLDGNGSPRNAIFLVVGVSLAIPFFGRTVVG